MVVGARSAIFAPLTNLGVIIIDEEHEATYKQDGNHATMRAMWQSCGQTIIEQLWSWGLLRRVLKHGLGLVEESMGD